MNTSKNNPQASTASHGDSPKGRYVYEYPRPALTADCVIFGFDGRRLKVLLVERGVEPYMGYWALPGGFMRMDETIDECARRELREETQLHEVFLRQFSVFSGVDRDPRGRVVTVAFIALVRPQDYLVAGGDDARRAEWFDAGQLPVLAFDHLEIVDAARAYLRELLKTTPAAFSLLNEAFSIDELRRVYEVINERAYDRRNFTRKLMQTGLVDEAIPEVGNSAMATPPPAECACCEEFEERALTSPRLGRPGKLYSLKRKISDIFKGPEADGNGEESTESDTPRDNGIKDLFNF